MPRSSNRIRRSRRPLRRSSNTSSSHPVADQPTRQYHLRSMLDHLFDAMQWTCAHDWMIIGSDV